MTVKKWTIAGIILITLACIAAGELTAGAIAIAGLVGFLKDDKE